MLVENRAGAAGAIGSEFVARQAPDGYNLLLGATTTHGINPVLQKLSYDPIKDFSMITLMAVSPQVLVAHPSMPVRSARDLVALAKSKPGQINYGSGKDVRDETIADAGEPVRVDWFTSSYVEIPLKP